ncbi:PD-(D/E)XK nuclease family protein [Akkermansiaceae bacterium]|nr:PD-(D/E)XK nuclease family protein [Akkermansiaceae bacterium]
MSSYLFGFHLDGAPAPIEKQGLQSTVCGCEGLLTALENSLGLPPVEVSPLLRCLTFRDIIEASLPDDQFYAQSFKNDPLATTRLLLDWRDTLHEAGWHSGLDHGAAPSRLKALAALESAFAGTNVASATHAGRIGNIRAELASGATAAIDSLVIIDPPATIPSCWSELFEDLGASYEDPAPSEALLAPTTTLGAAQANLLGGKSESPDNDGSLRIVTASTPEAAAEALASQLSSLELSSTTLIADATERCLLNRHLSHHDLPLTTAKAETAAALLELPTLLLRCRIGPLNPQAWIEFLLHSISPLPRKLRHRLAGAINNLPGRGPHWEEALEKSISENDDDNTVTRIRAAYADWVAIPPLDPEQLTGASLADILSPLTQWIAKRAGAKRSDNAPDASEWLSAFRAHAELEAILGNETELTVTELESLIIEWRQSVSSSTRFSGQVGAATTLASPAQLIAPQDHLIWWCPTPTNTTRSPWTGSELDWLATQNIHLLDESSLALAAEAASIRSVLLAGKSLTLYHVTQSAGGPTEQAGILTCLQSQSKPSLIVPARDLIDTKAIPLRPLPPLRRWWDLKQADLLPPRECESFSSVSNAINSPVDWALNYHAHLRQGPIAESRVNDSALRTGSVLHAAAEELFEHPSLNWRSSSKSETHQFLTDLLPDLLASQAAHYLTPGNEAARTRLLHTTQESLWHLIEILREAEVESVTLEKAVDPVPFTGGQIAGRIDLIARRSDGETAVIDLKLGGKTNRTKSLQSNLHLQLAIYGHLLDKSEGVDAATAFFILSNGGTLLTRNDTFFSNITPISPQRSTPESDWVECWQEFEEIYRWRRQQLDQGRIEVPVPGTEPDDPPPIERWGPPKDGNPYSAYSNLTGFPSNA